MDFLVHFPTWQAFNFYCMHFFSYRHPDESLYSLKSRLIYETLSYDYGGGQFKSTFFSKFPGSLDLPESLFEFYNSTRHLVDWTVNSIIDDHTLFPFYRAFLTEKKRVAVHKAMIYGAMGSVHSLAGINTSSLKRTNLPQFCPVCARSDVKKYGVAYWHRIHQIPGIQICSEHECKLIEYEPSLDEMCKTKFYVLQNDDLIISNIEANNCQTLLSIAREFSEIHKGDSKFDINKMNYAPILLQKGYYEKNRLRRKELCGEFQDYYKSTSNPLLKSFIRNCYYWLGTLVGSPLKVFNPYQHILFRQFFDSLKDFAVPQLVHPFRNGPWPCYNKISDHYMKEVITSMKYHINKTDNRVVGVFTCSCGMVYSKSFIRKKKGLEEYIKVQKYGDLWNRKLEEYISAGIAIRVIANLLGVSYQTIYRFLNKIPSKSPKDKNLAAKRSQWNQALKEFKLNRYNNSRLKYPGLYSWLYRNDREWLLSKNVKGNRQNLGLQLKINWKQVDDQLCEEIKKAILRLQIESPERRVCKTHIAKIVNKGKYIKSTNMDRLPKSKDYLLSKTESISEYQGRRIRRAVLDLKKQGRSVTKWNILKFAGISRPGKEILDLVMTKL